jgi:hypothetical protein
MAYYTPSPPCCRRAIYLNIQPPNDDENDPRFSVTKDSKGSEDSNIKDQDEDRIIEDATNNPDEWTGVENPDGSITLIKDGIFCGGSLSRIPAP